jgi:hypothetical protein
VDRGDAVQQLCGNSAGQLHINHVSGDHQI